ncbi:MAG: hypothetical protein AABW46_03005 [Nanoarchaeota archaeon]
MKSETNEGMKKRSMAELCSDDVVREIAGRERILELLIEAGRRDEKWGEESLRHGKLWSAYRSFKDAQKDYESAVINSGASIEEITRISYYGSGRRETYYALADPVVGGFVIENLNGLYRQAAEGILRCKELTRKARHQCAKEMLLDRDSSYFSILKKIIGFMIKDMKGGLRRK